MENICGKDSVFRVDMYSPGCAQCGTAQACKRASGFREKVNILFDLNCSDLHLCCNNLLS